MASLKLTIKEYELWDRLQWKTLDGNWGIYDTQDVIDVINYLSEMGFYDPKKIVLKGSSRFTLLNSLCEDIDVGCALLLWGQ